MKDETRMVKRWRLLSLFPLRPSPFAPRPSPFSARLGEVTQRNVSSDFTLLMPVVMRFKKGSIAGRVLVKGETIPFKVELDERPDSVEFNPLSAVLCEL